MTEGIPLGEVPVDDERAEFVGDELRLLPGDRTALLRPVHRAAPTAGPRGPWRSNVVPAMASFYQSPPRRGIARARGAGAATVGGRTA